MTAHYWYGGENDGEAVVTEGCIPVLRVAILGNTFTMVDSALQPADTNIAMQVEHWPHHLLRLRDGTIKHVYMKQELYDRLTK